MRSNLNITDLLRFIAQAEDFPGKPDSLSLLIGSNSDTEIFEDELEGVSAAASNKSVRKEQK